jgi:hypothetical protein
MVRAVVDRVLRGLLGRVVVYVSPLTVLGGICIPASGVGPRCGLTGITRTPWAPVEPNATGLPSESVESPQRGSSKKL